MRELKGRMLAWKDRGLGVGGYFHYRIPSTRDCSPRVSPLFSLLLGNYGGERAGEDLQPGDGTVWEVVQEASHTLSLSLYRQVFVCACVEHMWL